MKNKISLLGALAGAVGTGNTFGSSDNFLLAIFISITSINVAFLLIANRTKKPSRVDDETKKGTQ